jgi:hypothetical protein
MRLLNTIMLNLVISLPMDLSTSFSHIHEKMERPPFKISTTHTRRICQDIRRLLAVVNKPSRTIYNKFGLTPVASTEAAVQSSPS